MKTVYKVSTMKQLKKKLSVERISAEFPIAAEQLVKRFSVRKNSGTCHDDIGIYL